MTHALPSRRPLALTAAAIVAAAVLVLSPLASAPAHATSSASTAASILSSLNTARTAAAKPALKKNGVIALFASGEAAAAAKCGCFNPGKTATSPPSGWDFTGATHNGYDVVFVRLSGSNRTARLAAALKTANSSELLGDFNYGSVGFATKGSYGYAALVLLKYTFVPPELMKAGHPTITGSLRVGSTLTAHHGTFSPTPTMYEYRWRLNGVSVGTGKSTYKVAPGDLGKRLSVEVVGERDNFMTAYGDSKQTGKIGHGKIGTHTPTVSGSHRVGQLLTAHASWSPASVTLSYQWYRSGHKITGATSHQYLQTSKDLHKKLNVRVTGRSAGYTTVAKSSKRATTSSGVQTAHTPAISGTVAYGSTLHAVTSGWVASTTFSYQWKLNGVSVKGATHSSYAVPASAIGKRVSVAVKGAAKGYPTVSRTSATTAAVTKATFVESALPTVTGSINRGQVLTAHPGTWSGSPIFSYRWFRDGSPVVGATGLTYTTVSADVGHSFNIEVTVTKPNYFTATEFSFTVGPIQGP